MPNDRGMGEQMDPNDFGGRYHICSVGDGHWDGKPGQLFTDHDTLEDAERRLPGLEEAYPHLLVRIWDVHKSEWS